MLEVKCLTLGPLETNCYLLKQEKKAILIDAMVDQQGDIDRIVQALEDSQLLAVILTHGHYDHIAAVNLLFNRYQMPIYIHEDEADYLTEPKLNLSPLFSLNYTVDEPANIVSGHQLKIDDFIFEVIKTPGHTPGSMTLIIDNHAFVGDFLFKNSIGRTDLIKGSQELMRKSLSEAINWPDDWIIYPGHGPTSTMKDEKKSNPYLRTHR